MPLKDALGADPELPPFEMSDVITRRTSRILVDIAALGTTSLDSIYMRGVDPSRITLRTRPTTTHLAETAPRLVRVWC